MTNEISRRQQRFAKSIAEGPYDAVALNPGPALSYLTDIPLHLMERPIVALFQADRSPVIVIPELESPKFEGLGFPMDVVTYDERPSTWQASFDTALDKADLGGKLVAVNPLAFRLFEHDLITRTYPSPRIQSDATFVSALRLHKSAAEVNIIREAVRVAESALTTSVREIRTGITEKEFAGVLIRNLEAFCADPELPFGPIVSFGENAANPHAAPSRRALAEGDVILVDWGAFVDGYCSDICRVFSWGKAPSIIEEIADVVLNANQAGIAAAGPGIPASTIDAAARTVIEDAGCGDKFTHRTGHGIGMEIHEAPYIRADNDEPVEPGMVFTVEPGIYISGVGGIRIEDDVLITEDGCECLSTMPRQLIDLKG